MNGNFSQYINTGMIIINAIYLVASQTDAVQRSRVYGMYNEEVVDQSYAEHYYNVDSKTD